MKKGWQTKTIGDVCEFQRGLTYAKSDEVDFSNNVVLRATNIDLATNLLIFDELKYISDKVVVPESKKVKIGSLMICMASGSKSHLGKVAFIDDVYGYAFGGFMGMLTPLNGLLPKYLFHLMTSDDYKDFIGALSDGANINNLTFDKLKGFPVPVPPLAEQQRIVGLLDEAFEGLATAKANAEKNLQNARALFESHLQSVFTQRGPGWVETTLGEIGKVSMCKRIFKEETAAKGDIPFYKIGTFGKEPDAFIPSQTYNEYRAKYSFPDKGAVLISAAGTIGRRVRYDGEPAYFQDSNIVWIENDEKQALNDYLYHFYGACDWNSTKGATIPRLYNDNLRRISIGFPKSLQEQNRIVAQLDALSEEAQRLAHHYERKLAALEALKKSLLHQAFTGNL